MKQKVGALLTLCLVTVDALMVGLAFLGAYHLRVATKILPAINIAPFREYWGMLVIQVLTLLVIFFFHKLYHLKVGISSIDEFYAIFAAVSVGTIMTAAFTSLVFKNELDYPRLMVGYAWLLTIGSVTMGRLLLSAVERALRRRGVMAERVLIVGAGQLGRTILGKIRQAPELGYQVVGFVTDEERKGEVEGVPVLGTTAEIASIVDSVEPNEVVIALPDASSQEILSIISRCEKGGVSIKLLPDVFQIVTSGASIASVNGLPLLTVRDIALRGWRLTLKRAVDLVLSALALVLLSPMMLLVALLVKLESPGSIFYIQERMGLDALPFQMIKFRSMRQDAEEDGPGWTRKGDPRRTRMGAFMRRLSIDELPNLINVLFGEMSMVGPRPERPVYVERFKEMVPRYMERHKEKAGITGWAQVNGLRGDTSISERTTYDLWYIENWSLLLDFKIILRTLVQSIKGENAY